MFALSQNKCLIDHVNPRKELHGEDKVLACDMHFSCDMPNTVLTIFDEDLLSALYKQDQTRDMENPSHLPHLRFNPLGVIPWKLDLVADLVIHRDEGDLYLTEVKVNTFKLTCKEGGTVTVTFRAQIPGGITRETSGELDDMIQESYPITLEPRAPAEDATTRTRADNPDQGQLGLEEKAADQRAARADCFKLMQEAGYFAITSDVVDGWADEDIAQVRVYLLNCAMMPGSVQGLALPACLQAWLDRPQMVAGIVLPAAPVIE